MKWRKYEGTMVLSALAALSAYAASFMILGWMKGCFFAVAAFAFVLAVDLWPSCPSSEFLNGDRDRHDAKDEK